MRIEYSPALLQEVQTASGSIDAFGVLYGVRNGETIRLVSTKGRSGLDPVGVFGSRVRGKVFLTEDDLERFERSAASVAMVICGESGGFFVRDAAGAIETVRSYQEFPLAGPKVASQISVARPKWSWSWCLALMPLLIFALPRTNHPRLAVSLREDSGQLSVSWNIPVDATLTILDGGQRTSAAIRPGMSAMTYARRSGDVTVSIGAAQARYVGPPVKPTDIEQLRDSVQTLKKESASLRGSVTSGRAHIASLERRLQ